MQLSDIQKQVLVLALADGDLGEIHLTEGQFGHTDRALAVGRSEALAEGRIAEDAIAGLMANRLIKLEALGRLGKRYSLAPEGYRIAEELKKEDAN